MSNDEINNWVYFDWKEILHEAEIRLKYAKDQGNNYAAFKQEYHTLEYWTAYCAFANLSSVYS